MVKQNAKQNGKQETAEFPAGQQTVNQEAEQNRK